MPPAISQVSYWAAKQIHDGCQTKHGDLVIMTRWDVDIATDEQMQAESESEDTACLSDLDTLLNSTELYLSLAVKRNIHSAAHSLADGSVPYQETEKETQIAARGRCVSILRYLDLLSKPSSSP